MARQIRPPPDKAAPSSLLVDVPKLVNAHSTELPDPSVPAQRVAFGTSGHRGPACGVSLNEGWGLAIAQAICQFRKGRGIDGPRFLGIETHASAAGCRPAAM